MNAVDHAILTTLLLSVLTFVLVLAVAFVFLLLHRARRRQAQAGEAGETEAEATAGPGFGAAGGGLFGPRPAGWVAVRSKNPMAVQNALALHNPKTGTWAEVMGGRDRRTLFVAPPVAGWTLVVGEALPDPAVDVDVCFRFLCQLSRELGEVQFFRADPVIGDHAWARLDRGRVVRAYAWAEGRTLWNQGPRTAVEKALQLRCHEYGDPAETAGGVDNAERVPLLATCWSLDPGDLDAAFLTEAPGIVGERRTRG